MEDLNHVDELFYSVTLKSTGLSWTLNGSFTQAWFFITFYNIVHLKRIASLTLQIFQILTRYTASKIQIH